jgi:hypothetical protein
LPPNQCPAPFPISGTLLRHRQRPASSPLLF